jgi:cyclopropane fatty-acyl-phospholipid synthase-like methyltransferase
MGTITSSITGKVSQFKKPCGWLGRLLLRNMNERHSTLTDWGIAHLSIESRYTILDVGCGGGRTLYKLAERATQGKVHGVDYSDAERCSQ